MDDEPRLLSSLASLLRSQGYEVTEAEGGERACQLIDQQSFDLALLDLRMPGVDGFEVMAELSRKQPDCGTIVVSGESSFAAVSRALRRGALDYIRKPFDPEELLATVESVINKQSLMRAHEHIQVRLEKSEALHRYIVNTSPDIVFMLDEEGFICFINSKVESLLGYQPEELCGQHFRQILDDRDVSKGTWVELEISDTGTGIPEAVRDKLFAPVKTTKGDGHSGLGLSIVKQLVDDMDGIIACRTGSDGTTFRILLPATPHKKKTPDDKPTGTD